MKWIKNHDDIESQIIENFLQTMEDHPKAAISCYFNDQQVQCYETVDLQMPFADLVKKANTMLATQKMMDLDKIPKKSVSPITTTNATPDKTDNNNEVMVLFGNVVKDKATTIDKLIQDLKSLKNTVSQLQTQISNIKKGTSNKNNQPPFIYEKPDDPNEVKLWNAKPHFWCQHCNKGNGRWVTSHSTNGDPSNGIPAHQNNKRGRKSEHNGNANKKQRTNGINNINAAIAALSKN